MSRVYSGYPQLLLSTLTMNEKLYNTLKNRLSGPNE